MRYPWLDIGQVLFFCVFMGRDRLDGVEVYKKHIKRNKSQYPTFLTEPCSNEIFAIWDKVDHRRIFPCGTPGVIQNGKDSTIVAAQVANDSAGFIFSCPSMELGI